MCGAWTWWRAKGQRSLGRCWDCVTELSTAVTTPDHDRRVLHLLGRTFPGSMVIERNAEPRRYAPGTYVGPDAGPCRRCGKAVRLYGPLAYPFCADCDARRAAS